MKVIHQQQEQGELSEFILLMCTCAISLSCHGMTEQRIRVWQTHKKRLNVCMYVNACLTVRWRENTSMPQHPHTNTVLLPQLFLWGSGSDSCPSGLNRAHTVLKKKNTLSTLFRGLSPSLARSLSLSLSAGFCQAGQTKTLETPNTGTDSHNEHGNNTCSGKKKKKTTLPQPQRQWSRCLRDAINNFNHFQSNVDFWIKLIILCIHVLNLIQKVLYCFKFQSQK